MTDLEKMKKLFDELKIEYSFAEDEDYDSIEIGYAVVFLFNKHGEFDDLDY